MTFNLSQTNFKTRFVIELTVSGRRLIILLIELK